MSYPNYTDFVLDQEPAYWGDEKSFCLQTQRNNTSGLGVLFRGRNMRDLIQHGESMRGRHVDARQRTLRDYKPGQKGKGEQLQVRSNVEYFWRNKRDGSLSGQEEVDELMGSGDDKWITAYWTDKAEKDKARRDASMQEEMERSLFARPNFRTMVQGGDGPDGAPEWHSIFGLMWESANTLVPAAIDAEGTAWTTVGGKSPVTDTYWRNQVVPYTSATPSAPGNIFESIGEAGRRASWNNGQFRKAWSESFTPNVNEQGELDMDALGGNEFAGILTTSLGVKVVQRMRQAEQDHWTNPHTPEYSVYWNGVPFVWCAWMDAVNFWPTGAAGAASTETDPAGGAAGPRFFMVRNSYLKVCFKAGWMNKIKAKASSEENPTGWTIWSHVMGNFGAFDRRMLAVVNPSGNVVTA